MVDDVLQKATNRRNELSKELEDLNKFIALYRRFATVKVQDVVTGGGKLTTYPPTVTIRPSVETAAINILSDADRHLTTQEILNRLYDQEVHVGGKNPTNNLASVLSKSKEVINVKGKGWTLSSRDQNESEAPAITGASETVSEGSA